MAMHIPIQGDTFFTFTLLAASVKDCSSSPPPYHEYDTTRSMTSTIQVKATVLPGNILSIPVADIPVGNEVDVLIFAHKPKSESTKQSFLEFIRANRQPLSSYPSWEEFEKQFQA